MLEDLEQGPGIQGANEALLLSEVRFWRELIESLDDQTRPRESIERMHQALALAEFRLTGLFNNFDLSTTTSPQNTLGPLSH